VLGKNSRDIQRVVVGAFFDKDAFKEELEAEGLELRGTVEVGGEQCYEVYSPVKTPPQKAIAWAISAEDLLPRRITRYYASREPGGPDGSTMVTMTNLAANPKQAGDPFKLSVPEGYTKTDEFAP